MGNRPKLPSDLSGEDVRKIPERLGMTFKRQKGSHVILVGTGPRCRVVVPAHKNVRVGTLRTIISQAGLTVEAFLAARDGA